jgi:transcriptional regulator with XRE-family HTH domain
MRTDTGRHTVGEESMTEREAFGFELRRAREGRGLTLEEVSDRTKVSIAHFAGLERGDISRWPAGIFRRAFVRSYAVALGLDPEAVVIEFGRVFPESPEGQRQAARQIPAPPAANPVSPDGPAETSAEWPALRLVLDHSATPEHDRSVGATMRRAAMGLLDVALPAAVGGLAAAAAGRGWFWTATACAALVGHVVFFTATGATPGSWLLRRRRRQPSVITFGQRARRRAEPEAVVAGRRHVPRLPTTRPVGHAHRVRH